VLSKLKSFSFVAMGLLGLAAGASAQTVELRQWNGPSAYTRQPEQVMVSNMAEWRSLWSRVGTRAPDIFEPGRMNAIGIFLGLRQGPYSVNVISASRRRDRIMIVFEERGPPSDIMVAGHPPPPSMPPARALSAGPSFAPPGSSFAPPGAAANLAPAVPAPSPPPPANRPPPGPPTSPWAIVLINRTDLPITVEQRLFR
jgi:hypothetical protein